MDYLTVTDRNQIRMQCIDEMICDENPVWVIDALVKALNIKQLGFVKLKPEYDEDDSTFGRDKGGRPSYRPEDLINI